MSGGRTKLADSRPNASGSAPHQRQRRRQIASHKPPEAATAIPQAGMLGRFSTAPGQAVTPLAMAVLRSMPQLIGASASASSRTGISRQARIAHGITQNPVIGTARILAATE